VGCGNGVVWVIRTLRTANDVPPPCADTRACRDVVDDIVFVLQVLVAGKLWVVDILDRLEGRVRWVGGKVAGKGQT